MSHRCSSYDLHMEPSWISTKRAWLTSHTPMRPCVTHRYFLGMGWGIWLRVGIYRGGLLPWIRIVLIMRSWNFISKSKPSLVNVESPLTLINLRDNDSPTALARQTWTAAITGSLGTTSGKDTINILPPFFYYLLVSKVHWVGVGLSQ